MDLFIPGPRLTFEPLEKRAAATLEGDSSTWSRQILAELFREVPETSEYVPRVMMLKADDETGFGFGGIIITAGSDTALSTQTPDAKPQQVIIPVLIKGHELQPLDLLMHGRKMRPLNGVRLREALFRPATFDMVTKDWGDQSMYNMFYPPGRAENDFASGVSVTASGNSPSAVYGAGLKYAEAPLLDAVADTLNKEDLTKLAEEVGDSTLKEFLISNPAFLDRIAKLASLEPTALDTAEPVLQAIELAAPPDVVQMGYDPELESYWVKQASRAYAVSREPEYMGRRDFIKFAGEEVASKVDTDGTVTVAKPSQEVVPFDMDASKWEVVEHAGLYCVKTNDGRELTGWVLPNLIDLDGTRIPMAVFTNGSDAAVQDQIAGSYTASSTALRADKPQGTGVFYMVGPSGIEATVPLTILGREAGDDGAEVYHVKTLTDGDGSVKIIPGLRKMIASTEKSNMAMLPGSVRFLRLEKENTVSLVDQPAMITKTAEAIFSPKTRVWSDGMRFGIEFENMPKVASLLRTSDLSRDEAAFALCLVGADIPLARDTLNKVASSSGAAVLVGTRDVKLASDLTGPAIEVGREAVELTRSLRSDLLKEAAVLPDAQSIDAVLSLRFINPENVRMYVGYLPYLEKALGMICELVLAARLGMTEVPEFATARAARALDSAIQGLRGLALRDVDEYA